MKSCLKLPRPSPSASPASTSPSSSPSPLTASLPSLADRRKSVTFLPASPCEDGGSDGDDNDDDRLRVKEEVFYVDEWDRSPAETTRKLNYKDVLELMELRLALPRIGVGRRRSGSLESD
ncbi:uncharacterized protein FIBRA_03891 [Fibroporia radiculosa]|uniref:Uncharacterized protein n=1 Tax=Fibroporia radiculosa TaxID=599839 RepID=J4G6H9_9APHY|nr:uncharacterized protein FIBRA_03891 [Fibroporia radiculosa]CCM01823.1 predicted protein [Fibroporia radiculosa]